MNIAQYQHGMTFFVGSENTVRREGNAAGYQMLKNEPMSVLIQFEDGSTQWTSEHELFEEQYEEPIAIQPGEDTVEAGESDEEADASAEESDSEQ